MCVSVCVCAYVLMCMSGEQRTTCRISFFPFMVAPGIELMSIVWAGAFPC